MPESADNPPPTCPRCGYDQSGAIRAWTDACPIWGTCPECGLAFGWLDVFRPDRDLIRGFFEHTRGFWRSLRAIPRTAWLVARPWTFWRRVELRMRPRLGRTAAWLLLLLVGAWLLKGTLESIVVLLDELRPNPWATTPGWPRGGPWNDPLGERLLSAWLTPPIAVPYWTKPGWWGSWWYLPAWLAQWPVLLLIATPLWPICFALLPDTRRRCKVRTAHIARATIYSGAWLAILYSPLIIGALAAVLETALDVAGLGSPRFLRRLAGITDQLAWGDSGNAVSLAILCWLWLALWWLMAIKRGFRLPHAWGVWLSMLALTTLGTLLACALLSLAGIGLFRDHPMWFR